MRMTAIRLKVTIGLILFAVTTACGVKSRPLPPLTAPPIGRGDPSLLGTQDEPQKTPLQKKKMTMDDFEDEADF